MDKTTIRAYYDVEIDREQELPIRIHLTILTGYKREESKDGEKKASSEEHVAFHFEYKLSEFGKLEKPKIPAEAERLLR